MTGVQTCALPISGATVINEDLGDDLDVINPDFLGSCFKSTTSDTEDRKSVV